MSKEVLVAQGSLGYFALLQHPPLLCSQSLALVLQPAPREAVSTEQGQMGEQQPVPRGRTKSAEGKLNVSVLQSQQPGTPRAGART